MEVLLDSSGWIEFFTGRKRCQEPLFVTFHWAILSPAPSIQTTVPDTVFFSHWPNDMPLI